jgi:hypothetical protein
MKRIESQSGGGKVHGRTTTRAEIATLTEAALVQVMGGDGDYELCPPPTSGESGTTGPKPK